MSVLPPSLKAQEPRLKFCQRQVFHCKLRNQGCSFTSDFIGAVASNCLLYPTLSLASEQILRGAMGEISDFYNFSPTLFIFGTHIPPVITTCYKASLMSLTFFLSYDFLFLETRTYIQNLSPRTNFKYMI